MQNWKKQPKGNKQYYRITQRYLTIIALQQYENSPHMKEEILAINLLRFLAACSVLATHTFVSLISSGYIPSNLLFLSSFTNYGYLGVDLFFIISGFVITLSSDGRTLSQFVSARFIRLFPVFWICVSITALFILILGTSGAISAGQYLANLTMIPHLYGNHEHLDGSYWTLLVELKFYLVIAAVLLLRTIINIPLQKFAIFASLPLLYSALYYDPYSTTFINNFVGSVFHLYAEDYAQYFIAGILFYGIYRNSRQYYNYLALSICYIVAVIEGVSVNENYLLNPWITTLYITLFFGLFLIISLKKISNSSLALLGMNYRKILILLGAVTYPLYLLHSKITSIFIETFSRDIIPPYIALPLLVFLLTSLVVMVTSIDEHIHTLWKRSTVIKVLIMRNTSPQLRKFIAGVYK